MVERHPPITEPPITERQGSPALAVPAALLAAIAGGIAWGLIVKWTEYEVGIVAWGIGFLTGTAAVLATRGGKGPVLQAIAIVTALLGILLGKYLSYAFDVQDQAEEAGVSLGLFSGDMRSFFREDLDKVFGLFDLLWVGFAVYTAWRVPQQQGPGPEPAPRPS
ncbi:MAG: hypothetical protein H0V79_08735 [Actinobacteria bacterium]|nr:hypothetical protein [Actinomycetota bacterium]